MAYEEARVPSTCQRPSWQPFLLIATIAIIVMLMVIALLAYLVEGATIGLYGTLFYAIMVGIPLYWLCYMPRVLINHDGELAIAWWWRTRTIDIGTITALRQSRYQLIIEYTAGSARCTFLTPNDVPTLLTWLETEIPALVEFRRANRMNQLPLILTPRLTAPIITTIISLIFGIVGGGLLWHSWQEWQRGDGSGDGIGMVIFALLTLALAALFLYMVLDSYIWRIVFDEETITLRHTFHVERYPARQVTHMVLATEERTVKGFVHQIYKLHLFLMDGTVVEIAPNLPSFPMDYAGAEEARLLADVQQVLEAHYVAVVRVEPDPATMADERWGTPVLAIQWQIRPYDLTVTRLDYGEHHAASSTIHILVGHSEAGAIRFRTTNGDSRISPDGRFIIIFDDTFLVAFNLTNGRTYHRACRRGWLYAQVELVDEMLVIEEMRRTDIHQREQRKPISLETPTSALRRGFGSAEDGRFPSAYG